METVAKVIEPCGTEVLGIDLGLKEFLIDSNGNKGSNPRFLKTSLKRLKRLSRKHSKSKIDSNNRDKQKIKLANLHRRVANQRNDFLHKESFKIANDNQVSTIVVETLKIKNMVKNRCLSRAISDVSWGKFINYLEYKLYRLGKRLIKISTFFPSSKTCSNCNNIKQDLQLKDRTYKCDKCELTIDRDINAAINIKNEGLRISTVGITGI